MIEEQYHLAINIHIAPPPRFYVGFGIYKSSDDCSK